MIKSMLKEICIMLLLCVAIVLVLGVVFYDYIPTNKAIPNKLANYKTPVNVQAVIQEQIAQMEKENVTYTITGADLDLYKQTNSYVSGKPDPFSASTEVTGNNTNNNNTNNNNSNSNTNNNNSNSNSNNNNTNSNNSNNNTNNNTNNNNTNSNNSNEAKPTTDPNSTGTFFNETGLK